MTQPERLIKCGSELGEGPVWHPDEGALYWLDILGKTLWRWSPDNGESSQIILPEIITCVVPCTAGGWAATTADGFVLLDDAGTITQRLAQPETHRPNARFNDGAVDPLGRFWAGTMDHDGTEDNSLYVLDSDGTAHLMDTGFMVSNGIDWSPDERTMYFADSPRRIIYAYTFDSSSGTISDRRVFVHTPESTGVPDGLTVDAEGYIWCAYWDGWEVVRYAPNGEVTAVLPMPVQRPTSCTFGESLSHGNSLFITSARTDLNDAQLATQPAAGDLFRYKTSISGKPKPLYRFNG